MEPIKLTYDQLVVEYQSKLSEITDQLLFKNAENKELVKIIEQQEQEITTRNNMINDLNIFRLFVIFKKILFNILNLLLKFLY